MPQLVIPKTYKSNRALRVSDLDNIKLTVEAFINSTKLDSANLQLDSLLQAFSSAQSKAILERSEIGQETGGTVSSVTVLDSGFYFAKVKTTNTSATGGSGFPPSGANSVSIPVELVISVNSIEDLNVSYDDSIVFATSTSGFLKSLTYQSGLTGIAGRNLTETDVIEVEDASNTAQIEIMKGFET